jgi:hypothetical protein
MRPADSLLTGFLSTQRRHIDFVRVAGAAC